ncbi:hypothetical protein SprV_0100460800 [Sparganum proliferum]
MGSLISAFIAEAVLQRLDSLDLQHHKPKFWARFVDDAFVVIEQDQMLTFHEHLNAVLPDIQFTMEEKENHQLAFLDVLVCHKDCGGLKTKTAFWTRLFASIGTATLVALENLDAIRPTDRRMTRVQEKALARLYRLLKLQMRALFSSLSCRPKDTPTFRQVKWLFRRPKRLTADSDPTVCSSTQFLEKHKGDLTIKTVELLLQRNYNETENRLGHDQVLQLLMFCLRTHFTLDGTIYAQVKGTSMGSLISGLIAEAVPQRLESLVFQHHRPKFWARYMGDTAVLIERYQMRTFKESLDNFFPDIKFTMEKEEENDQVVFLDVHVCRKDCDFLKTKVLRKATNTMQVLNVNNNHSISHKRSCVWTLYRRVETHCSKPEDKAVEFQYLRRVFRRSG